jgi:hypothetical protein
MSGDINFCRPGQMSECTASKEQQKQCKFYEKSSVNNGCMYKRFPLDCFRHCDCYIAQRHARDEIASLEDCIEIIDETNEGIVPT